MCCLPVVATPTTSEIYWYGGLVTLLNTVLFLTVGTAWILLVYRMIA